MWVKTKRLRVREEGQGERSVSGGRGTSVGERGDSIYLLFSSCLSLQPTAVMRAAPLPLPSSDSRKFTSHWGASSFTVWCIIREKLKNRKNIFWIMLQKRFLKKSHSWKKKIKTSSYSDRCEASWVCGIWQGVCTRTASREWSTSRNLSGTSIWV